MMNLDFNKEGEEKSAVNDQVSNSYSSQALIVTFEDVSQH